MAKLIVHLSGGESQEYDLGSLPLVTVGRDEDNTVVLSSPHVSRNHFLLEKMSDGYRLVNRSQTQGTFLNGVRSESALLRGGEMIAAGDVKIMLQAGSESAALPAAPVSEGALNSSLSSPAFDPEKSGLLSLDGDADDPDMLACADPADSTMLRMALEANSSHNTTEELHRRFVLIQDIVQEMVTQLRLDQLLDFILERVFEILHADNGAVLLVDPEKNLLVPKAVRQRSESKASKQLKISRTLIRKVCQERLAYLCADAQSDEALRSQKSIMAFGIRSAMCVPLLFRGDLLGVIHIDSESAQNAFSKADLQLLTLMANQAAVSVRNASLHDRIVKAETQRTNLGRYFSPQIVDRICSNEIDLELGGRNVEVSLLYSDIRGFTPLSERVSAQELVAFLNSYFTEMADIVFQFNGTCDKFIGDALLAVFGSPIADEGHAAHAAQCALAMIHRLREMTFGVGPIQIGIGLHCGRVIHGNIGSERVMQYTVIGDIVNTTARLSDVAKPSQIVMSAAMREMLEDQAATKPLGFVTLKGKSAPMETFELVARSAEPAE